MFFYCAKKSSLCEASKGRGKAAEAEQAHSCHVLVLHQKSSLCEASKGRGKAKRGRGRGKDSDTAAPEHSVVSCRCPDFLDVDWVRQMGAMPGSLYIDTRFAESRGEGPIRSLRTVCCQLLERASADGSLDCWYKEDKLPRALSTQGRTWSGISLEEMTEAETAELSALRCSSGYDATRSCFTYRKEVKELLRGGFEQDANFRDYDLKTSFPRAFSARHPEAACVRSWVDGSFDLRGLSRDVAKSFINQCFGVGQKGIRDWCRAHGFSELPEPLQRYLAEIQRGSRQDVADCADNVETLQRSGRSGSQDVQNAIVYVLNSCYERGQLDAAAWRVRNLATVRCWELDGLFLERHDAASWAEVEAALGPHFAHKPYRSCSELLQGLLKDANVGAMPELWQPTTTNWLKAEMTALECAARLKQSGEAPPVVWLPQALSTQPLAPGLLLRDKYKLPGLSVFRSPSPSQPRVVCFRTSPCSGKSVELFKCQANRNGYLWVGTHGALDNELESDVVQTLCNLVRVPSVLQAPGEFLSGRLTASVMSRLDWPLFDADFMRRLDAEPTWQFMAFACGTTMELASGELGQASPQQCLKRHVSYPYPAKEMASIAAQEEALGISCLDTFKEIAEWLRHPLNQENPVFPAQIRSKLEKLTDGIPELVFFKLMHDSFTPRYDQQECPSPETYGGWQATVFRTMVALAAGLGCSHENSIFDLGEEGDNGKGVLAAATRETFDGYYEELPLATVTKDPPSGNETSPRVYKLQGARFLGTPESEKSIAIKAIWIKLLADNSTRWTARTLYKLDLQFRIPALFALSSNLKVNLTSIDGGVRRRIIGCAWPVSFKLAPKGPFQRVRSPVDLKRSSFYTPAVKAGILHVTMAAFQAFCMEGGGKLELQPKVIKDATLVLLSTEYSEYLAEFLEKCTEECTGKEGTSKLKLVGAMRAHILGELGEDKINMDVFHKALGAVCATKVPHGTTEKLMRLSSRRYLKLSD